MQKTINSEGFVAVYEQKSKTYYASHQKRFGSGVIIDTDKIEQALVGESPAQLMEWLGGHCKSYEARAIRVVRTFTVSDVQTAYPEVGEE